MAKGWVDRVFVNGLAYEYPGTVPWTGPLNDKRALTIFTSSNGREDFDRRAGASIEAMLYPLLWGTFAYCGMQVLEPFVAYAADSVDEETRDGYLTSLSSRLERSRARRRWRWGRASPSDEPRADRDQDQVEHERRDVAEP